MKAKICAGNWKLNKTPKESSEFLTDFFGEVPDKDIHNFVIFPPASNWFVFSGQKKMGWGAQNIYFENSGAFTGENSADVLKQMSGTHALVGHSERRQVFQETDDWMAKKVLLLQSQNIIPVLCVGETLEEREANKTEEVIGRQLNAVLKKIEISSKLWVAYEPVWAIGTGKVASPEQAEEAHTYLRGQLENLWGSENAEQVPLLYGGSVKPDNAKNLGQRKNIDGFLIGGASLKVDSFVGIYRAANSL